MNSDKLSSEQLRNEYLNVPTACVADPKVMKDIQKSLRASHVLSVADARLARRMGLISTPSITPFGFNDGTLYPPDELRATRSPRLAMMSRAARASTPRTMHALALLVDFNDNAGRRAPAEFQRLLFDAQNPNSLTSFYRDLSYGALTVTGEVTDWVRVPQKYSFYTDGQSGTGTNYPRNTPGLLVDALTEYCKTKSLAAFDKDGDGYIDAIFLIHAGSGAEAEPVASKRPHMIWSHKWVLPSPFVNSGVRVYAYSTEPEDGRVGVFCHEFGHSLGLPDLYDTSYRTNGVGNWCLMGGGSWGGGGNQPTRMSAWCLANLGWIKPQNVSAATTLKISDVASNPKHVYRLWTKGKSGPEYFLLENRQKQGRDAALPGSGLAVWHVDERQSDNTNPNNYKVGLAQADGKRDLERAANQGDNGDVFPGKSKVGTMNDSTMPSTRAYSGVRSGVGLSKIRMSSGIVSVTVKV